MKKYRKFLASRYQYPTRVIQNANKGMLVIGHVEAKQDIERRIGRRLADKTVVRKRAGNWVFCEPKKLRAKESTP